ncbi:MAG: hypothetical protein IH851_08825 [Armatimonadetes bacterium]|nr:hypothetical protein [Armatimonadota bacterium]
MKLNLVPKAVAKDVASRTTFFVVLIAVIASLVGAFALNLNNQGELSKWKGMAEQKKEHADRVVATAAHADDVISEATIILTNTQLVQDIDAANMAYPVLYDGIREYIPSFFRVRTMEAQSTGANAATVTITGYLKTFEQYSDIMIALLRYPRAVGVGRSGFAPVAEGDEGPFDYGPETSERGPIPGWSEVTIIVAVAVGGPDFPTGLQVPDPMPTLQAASRGAAPAGPGAGGGPGGRARPTLGGGAAAGAGGAS